MYELGELQNVPVLVGTRTNDCANYRLACMPLRHTHPSAFSTRRRESAPGTLAAGAELPYFFDRIRFLSVLSALSDGRGLHNMAYRTPLPYPRLASLPYPCLASLPYAPCCCS